MRTQAAAAYAAILLLVLGAVESGTRAATRSWSITVCGPSYDPRRAAIADAVEFWNDQLTAIDARIRLGPVTTCDRIFPDDILNKISEGVLGRGSVGGLVRTFDVLPTDIVVALSGVDLVSVGIPPQGGRRGVVILRRPDIPPLSLPNVARNVAAHELGHVLGLPHNSDPATLMCGRPAACRPAIFQSETKHFFPLTEADRQSLTHKYR